MTNNDNEIIGKTVKDMYGATMGKAVGTMTDIDGTILVVGVDCGSQGLLQVPFEQVVVHDDVVIFIPKWRLESQRLLREKGLTLRRLRALMEILSEDDEMKADAEIINEKYKTKLAGFEDIEKAIHQKLAERMAHLDERLKAVKNMLFDAKVQFKSNEITESEFETVKRHTTDLIEHITHETAEITNVQNRITDLNMDAQEAMNGSPKPLQDSAVKYLDAKDEVESKLPDVPAQEPPAAAPVTHETEARFPEPPNSAPQEKTQPAHEKTQPAHDKPRERSDWMSRMESQ